MAAAFPTLQTTRLTLTVPTLTDFAELAAMWGDPVVVERMGGVPLTDEESWQRLQRYVGHWHLLGFGTWVVREKSGAWVGEVGLFDLHRTLDTPLDIPEAGWVLAQRAHGKGYATEAVQAVLAWGDAHFGARPFSCMIDVDNVASLRVADKCGFREYTRTQYKGKDVILFRRSLVSAHAIQ